MKKRFTPKGWQLAVSQAKDASARRELMQSLTRGDVEVTDENGRVLDFTPPPDRLGPSPLPPFPVRDRSGNVVQEAAPSKSDRAPETKSFSLNDRAAFENCIADEPAIKKIEMRLWFDQQRKEHGIN